MAYEQGDRRRKIQEVIGLMQKNLECSICLEMMNNPVSTNCGHQFCRFCLMEFLERKKHVPCPLCKKMITKRSLMDRSQLGQMVENVRNLITAFQADTGWLFSPPRGPQLTDLIPCTPDTIQAKTVTEVNGKRTASLDKKTGKQRNVRISRQKTLDNAEINVNGDQEQTSSSGISDSGTGSSVALVDKRLASRKTRRTVSSSRELLQCIENGVHHRTDTSRLTGTTENIQPKAADNSSYHDIENSTSVTCDGLHSKHYEKSRMDDLCEQNSRVQTSVSDAVESQLSKDKENSCESNTLETVENCGAVHESIKEGEAVLFQTPLPLNSVEKLKRLPDQVDNSNKTARNLRSREKISNTIEENDSIACREQLTPDDFNDNETSGFEQNKPFDDVKTYSKRGSIKQDKEANKKVKDWLKSVEVTKEKKDMQNVVGSKVTRKKQNLTKKDLKVKAEEEKMGLKMKHLAEHITSDKTEETDSCFGFDDNAEVKESTPLQGDKDERHTDDKSHKDIDMTIDQETPKGKVELLEKDDNLDHISDNQEHVHETKKTSSATISPDSCVNKSAKPTLLNKKHIFKAKLTNKDNVVRESFIVDSKIENEVNEVKNATTLCEGAENRLSADQDLPDSDPYEFKSSGNTPRKPGKKKGKTSKAGAKKKTSKLSQKMVGSAKSKSSKGKQNTKSNMICIEDKPISCTQEEIKKISSKLNQAEDYDLLTCTQEAVDSLEKNGIDLNNENDIAYPIDTEMMDIKEQNGEMKSKASHQKKVRFKDPVLSDFRHDGKIDILGYRKAKEKMNKSDSSACDDNVKYISETEHENPSEVEVPKLEEGENVEDEDDRIENKSNRVEDITDYEKNDSHNLGSVKKKHHQEKQIDKVDTSSSSVDGKSAIQTDKAMGRTTPIKNVDSPARVYKNPMMTPTILKRSPGAKIMEENDTMEDEINSSGTDDLDINPEEDQFEEPVLEIQPDDIKEKLSSQELFVRNVLSSPQDGARQKPSPQIIEETPMVFSVPSKNKFKKLKRDKSSKSETHHDKNILTVSETPMITISDNMSQPLNKPLSEERSENIELDPKEPSKGFKDSPKSTFGKDQVKDWTESDETQPPSDINTAVPSFLRQSKSPVVCHSVSTNQEADINHEVESSVENSISLLNQYDNDVIVAANCKTSNDEENVESILEEIKNVPKSKKKRKSFMLQEEENYNASPLSVTSPVQTSTAEPVPKKKKLSRSAKKSNTKTLKTDLSEVGSMDVVTISESVQSEISTLEAQSLTEQDAAESQASCVPQTNSEVNVCENPQIMSKKIMIEDSVDACYEDKLDDERNETLSKNTQKISQRENICMVPETEMINCSDTLVTCSLNVVTDIEESQCPKTKEQENTHLEHDTNHNENVSTTFETDISHEDQNPMKTSQTTRKLKTSTKKNSQNEIEGHKTKEHKQRHLSGILVSPEENIIYSSGKGSPEDIFNMDSELPFVDNSPLEGVNQSESVLEKEETVTNNMLSEHVESVEDPATGNQTELSKKEKETVGRRYKSKKSANNDIDEAKHSEPDSDSESDISQQVRKQKRLSGVKGARGLANRKKQSSSSNSASPFSPKSVNPSETKSRKHTHISPTVNGSENSQQKEVTESSIIDITDSHENQNNYNSKLYVDDAEAEPVTDLSDLSQRLSQKKNQNNDADINTVNSAISHVEESETVLVDSAIEIDLEKQEDPDINELDDKKSIEMANEVKAIDNDVDSTSSEFELSSSSEHSQNCVEKNESDAIDKCIREAKDKISDIEQTLSEIVDKGSDNESCLSSQESKNTELGKHKMNSKAAEDDEHYQNVNTSSPLPELNTEEPMEVLESDIEPDDAHLNKNTGTKDRNNDSDDGHKKEISGIRERDSDSDEGPVTKKKSKKAVIADSSDDEDDMSHHMNMTSSSAFSSQSENLTTQDRHALEKDLERMAREMEALKAQLNRGRSSGAANRSSSDYTGQSQKGEMQVVAVEDSSDIDELIEMDDSVTEHSDNDMFLSPPPLALSQHDNSKQDIDQEVTSQPDKSDNQTPIHNQKKEHEPKQRPALADLDINRPLSPGRKTPKVFVATGLTLHQVQETKKLASLNDCKFFTKFNESVTHVIVKPSKESEFLCDRTLKLFQGIANKCWIVNYYWVMDSRHAGHLVPEGPYEIQGDTANGEQHQGPMKSRMSSTNLFEKFSFMCVGDCPGLTVDDMTSLIQTCGGAVVSDVDCLRTTDRTPLIVTCSDVEDEDGDVQVSSQDIAMFNKHYKSHQVVTVSREWVLDSLTLYQLQPLKEYVVTSVKNMIVPKIV